jgi:hypothetical protein
MNMEVTLVKFVRQALQIRVECVRSVTSFLWQSTACRDVQKKLRYNGSLGSVCLDSYHGALVLAVQVGRVPPVGKVLG